MKSWEPRMKAQQNLTLNNVKLPHTRVKLMNLSSCQALNLKHVYLYIK